MSKVLKQVQNLNKISFTGVKSQILIDSAKCSGLKLTFQYENHNGHMGARKFMTNCLRTLKFYNPNLIFDVTRIKNPDRKDASVPCKLDILSVDGKVSNSVDMKNRQYEDIMDELLTKVDHKPVPPEEVIEIK